jgi:alcohol dehydrogenase
MTSTMRAVQVSQIDAPLRVVDLPQPSPGRGQVRIAVEACGICGSDASMVHGLFGDGPFPLTPGHEIAGRIDMLGDGVEGWESATGWPWAGSAATTAAVGPAARGMRSTA